MQRIFVLSDQRTLRDRLAKRLIRAGHAALGERITGESWAESAAKTPPSIMIVDAATGDEPVDDRLRRVRQELGILGLGKVWVLALISPKDLSGRDLLPGSDDFMVAGGSDDEIMLRVAMAAARLSGKSSQGVMRFGELVIDLESYRVHVADREVKLTLREFELLKFLAQSAGRAFSRESLLAQIWGYDYFGGQRTVDVHIRRLRSKLGPLGARLLETVRGIGYKLAGGPEAARG